jgi:hypothetical protein
MPAVLAVGGSIKSQDYDTDSGWTAACACYEPDKSTPIYIRGLVYSATWDSTASISTPESQHWHNYDPKNLMKIYGSQVGGTLHDSYARLRNSIMEVLMALPPATRVHPGHTDPTTIGDEWDQNPFVRIWRGLDAEGTERCTALDRPATLVLFAPDYDGGNKGWVRWEDTQADDIVPGSRVVR